MSTPGSREWDNLENHNEELPTEGDVIRVATFVQRPRYYVVDKREGYHMRLEYDTGRFERYSVAGIVRNLAVGMWEIVDAEDLEDLEAELPSHVRSSIAEPFEV